MQQADLMLTTAQIGMAFAGFAGLITLLRRPGPRTDARLNEIRFRSMMELSLTLAVWLGLLLNALGVFPGLESGVYFAALFGHFLAAAFFFIRLLYGAFPHEEG